MNWGALQMHGNNVVPILLAHRREGLVTEYACVRDQDVHTAKSFKRNLDDSMAILSGSDCRNSFTPRY